MVLEEYILFGYTLPNIIIVLSLAGIIALLARRFTEAEKLVVEDTQKPKTLSRFDWIKQGWARKISRFLLEAKGLYHPQASKVRMQHLLVSQKNEQELSGRKQIPAIKVRSGGVKPPKVKITSQKTKLDSVAEIVQKSSAQQTETLEEVGLQGREKILEEGASPSHASSMPLKALQEAHRLLDLKQYARARKILQDVAPSFMKDPDVWAKLGFSQYQLGDYSGSVHSYSYALALDSDKPNRYYNLSLSYLALGDHASALKNIDKALVLSENEKYQKTKDYIVKASTKG